MTVPAVRSVSDVQVASGVGREWVYGFRVLKAEQIMLAVYDDEGAVEYIAYSDDVMAVTGVGSNTGGTVTYPLEPDDELPAGYEVVVLRRSTFAQAVEITTQGAFHRHIHQDALDALAMQIQEMRDQGVSTNVRAHVTDPEDIEMMLPPAADRAGKVMAFDENGEPSTDLSAEDIADVAASAAAAIDAAEDAEAAADASEASATAAAASAAEAAGYAEALGDPAPASLDYVTLTDQTANLPSSRRLEDSSTVEVNLGAGIVTFSVAAGSLAFSKLAAAAIASQAEAEAGAASTKLMTPERTAQAIAALTPSPTTGVGRIEAWPCTTAPAKRMKANGALLNRVDYPELWAFAEASGNIVAEASWAANPLAFSTGDTVNTFRIPDPRGYFLRGWDNGRGVDSGRAIGSLQADANLSHSHTASGSASYVSGVGGISPVIQQGDGAYVSLTYGSSVAVTVNAAGGTEARPKNLAVLYTIQYED
jgi:hypothetical protein